MSVIQVGLVGRSTLHREGLRWALDADRFVVVAEERDLAGILAILDRGVCPGLIIVDVNRMSESEFEDLCRLRNASPEARIVVLSEELYFPDVGRVFGAGADGYLVSELSREAFSLSLLVIMSGEKVLPGSLADRLASNCRDLVASKVANAPHDLTEREREILRCLLRGHSNKLIARALQIAEGTVKVHLKTVMKKIAAANRTQAALWARSQGFGENADAAASAQSATAEADPLPLAGYVGNGSPRQWGDALPNVSIANSRSNAHSMGAAEWALRRP